MPLEWTICAGILLSVFNRLAQARARRFTNSPEDVCWLTQHCRQRLRKHHSIIQELFRF